MHLFLNPSKNQTTYFSILFAAYPVSFIAGNMIININTILIILSAFFIFKINNFSLKFFIEDKLIFLFFILVFFSSVSADFFFYTNKLFHETSHGLGYLTTSIKSLFFLKYLFLYISIKILVENKVLNLKYFFISCAICSLFVSIDIIIQLVFGKDVFGYEIIEGSRKLGGPFGEELIAGGYIQRFSLFTFFVLPIFFNLEKIKKIIFFSLPILFILFSISLILAGNRMHLILFLMIVFLIFITHKQLRKFFLHFTLIFVVVFTLLFNFNSEIKKNFRNFYFSVTSMISLSLDEDKKPIPFSHFQEFNTFYETWLMHKYIGGGIKNFRYFCHARPVKNDQKHYACNMHPHNYYLEILTETGVFGLVIILGIFIITFYKTFYKKYITRSSLKENKLIIPFIFLFIAEIFPIKSTGSFFTTGNTTYIFLILAILLTLTRNDNSIENKP